jgi:hypothetical protein
MSDVEQMLRTQMQNDLTRQLDSAVQAGDINAARKATQQLAELHLQNVKATPVQFTNADIRAALKVKAPWFGVDPRRSARAVEFGKNMEPQSFKSADEFADRLIEAVAEEFEEAEEPDEIEDEEKEEKKIARKKTDAPSGDTRRAIPRRTSGPWAKLSDAPKEIADTIKSAADKFTRNATKEQREKYIATALGTAYAADQRAKGKK